MKKIILLSLFLITLAITFFACSEERDHANPYDPEYWDSDKTPSDIAITGLSLSSAKISWTDNSVEDRFVIERKFSYATTWSEIGEVTGDKISSVTKTYTDINLEAEQTYNYRIKAVYGEFESDFAQSYTYTSRLPAPSSLKTTVLNESSIMLTWNDNSEGEEGFKIDRRIGSTGEWLIDYETIDANIDTWTDTELTLGIVYYYRVRAYNSTYYSLYSKIVSMSPWNPINFIEIPIGTFNMGSTSLDEQPIHTVDISRAYYLGKYEVTQKEWETTIGSNPASGCGVGDNYPVYQVSWYDILVYCNKRSANEGLEPCFSINGSTNPTDWGNVPSSSNSTWDIVECNFDAKGYRMPTEAEREYAARYNDERIYPWGDTLPSSSLCNYNNNVDATTVWSIPENLDKMLRPT
jgi:hypothetical protein